MYGLSAKERLAALQKKGQKDNTPSSFGAKKGKPTFGKKQETEAPPEKKEKKEPPKKTEDTGKKEEQGPKAAEVKKEPTKGTEKEPSAKKSTEKPEGTKASENKTPQKKEDKKVEEKKADTNKIPGKKPLETKKDDQGKGNMSRKGSSSFLEDAKAMLKKRGSKETLQDARAGLRKASADKGKPAAKPSSKTAGDGTVTLSVDTEMEDISGEVEANKALAAGMASPVVDTSKSKKAPVPAKKEEPKKNEPQKKEEAKKDTAPAAKKPEPKKPEPKKPEPKQPEAKKQEVKKEPEKKPVPPKAEPEKKAEPPKKEPVKKAEPPKKEPVKTPEVQRKGVPTKKDEPDAKVQAAVPAKPQESKKEPAKPAADQNKKVPAAAPKPSTVADKPGQAPPAVGDAAQPAAGAKTAAPGSPATGQAAAPATQEAKPGQPATPSKPGTAEAAKSGASQSGKPGSPAPAAASQAAQPGRATAAAAPAGGQPGKQVPAAAAAAQNARPGQAAPAATPATGAAAKPSPAAPASAAKPAEAAKVTPTAAKPAASAPAAGQQAKPGQATPAAAPKQAVAAPGGQATPAATPAAQPGKPTPAQAAPAAAPAVQPGKPTPAQATPAVTPAAQPGKPTPAQAAPATTPAAQPGKPTPAQAVPAQKAEEQKKDVPAVKKEQPQPKKEYTESQQLFIPAPDEFYNTLFYFSGMGSVIGDATRSGVYVSKSTSKRGLDAEILEEEDSKRRRSTSRQRDLVESARTQATDLTSELRKLQRLLESLPTFGEGVDVTQLQNAATPVPPPGGAEPVQPGTPQPMEVGSNIQAQQAIAAQAGLPGSPHRVSSPAGNVQMSIISHDVPDARLGVQSPIPTKPYIEVPQAQELFLTAQQASVNQVAEAETQAADVITPAMERQAKAEYAAMQTASEGKFSPQVQAVMPVRACPTPPPSPGGRVSPMPRQRNIQSPMRQAYSPGPMQPVQITSNAYQTPLYAQPKPIQVLPPMAIKVGEEPSRKSPVPWANSVSPQPGEERFNAAQSARKSPSAYNSAAPAPQAAYQPSQIDLEKARAASQPPNVGRNSPMASPGIQRSGAFQPVRTGTPTHPNVGVFDPERTRRHGSQPPGISGREVGVHTGQVPLSGLDQRPWQDRFGSSGVRDYTKPKPFGSGSLADDEDLKPWLRSKARAAEVHTIYHPQPAHPHKAHTPVQYGSANDITSYTPFLTSKKTHEDYVHKLCNASERSFSPVPSKHRPSPMTTNPQFRPVSAYSDL